MCQAPPASAALCILCELSNAIMLTVHLGTAMSLKPHAQHNKSKVSLHRALCRRPGVVAVPCCPICQMFELRTGGHSNCSEYAC